MDLFGFSTQTELDSFKLLITVSGVGPKAAMAVLSELTPDRLAVAIAAGSITEESAASEAVAALVALGFGQSDAAVAVGQMDKSLSADEMIRLGLKQLSRNL